MGAYFSADLATTDSRSHARRLGNQFYRLTVRHIVFGFAAANEKVRVRLVVCDVNCSQCKRHSSNKQKNVYLDYYYYGECAASLSRRPFSMCADPGAEIRSLLLPARAFLDRNFHCEFICGGRGGEGDSIGRRCRYRSERSYDLHASAPPPPHVRTDQIGECEW